MKMNKTVIGKVYKFNVSFRPVTMTAHAGIVLLRDFIERLGLVDLIDERVVVKKRERGYRESENILSLCWNAIVGGSCLRDLDVLRGDEGIPQLLGVESVMAPTTAGEFLRDFTDRDLKALQSVYRILSERARQYQKKGRVTLDLDASLYEQCSVRKEGSRMNYKGEIGYYPLFIFRAETKEIIQAELLSGNASVAPRSVELIREGLKNIPRGKRKFLRADSEFYIWDLIKFCEANKITYAITADQTKYLKAKLEGIPENQWRPYDAESQVAEMIYAPDRHQPHRYIVTRRRVQDKQGVVGWRYHVVITNDKRSGAGRLMRWATGRCAMENLIKEHKRDFGFEKMPSQKFQANWAWLLISQLAWNLVAWFNRICLPQECHKLTVTTLRHRLLNVAAKIVHQSRQYYLVLSEENRFKEWWLFAINKLTKLQPGCP